MTFPEGITVDIEGASLSSRKNGHELSIESMGNQQFFISISEASTTSFSGESGIIMTLPVVLSDTLKAGNRYPINLSEVYVTGPAGNVSCPSKNGGFTIESNQASLYASFYPDIYLNRAKFINLSAASTENYQWNFGDGETSVEKEPLHIYEKGGIYNVQLKVSSGELTDSASFQILINPSNQWKTGGHFTINPEMIDVKNFDGIFSLFELLDKADITGNIDIDVSSGYSFNYPMIDTLPDILNRVAEELNTEKRVLTFNSSNEQFYPELNFTSNINQNNIDILRKLWNSTHLNRVKFSIENKPIHIEILKNLEHQFVCSGYYSTSIDLKQINQELNYQWIISKEPTTTTGFVNSGSDTIPSMELVNNGIMNDTLIYTVDADIPNTSFNSLMTHQLVVKPQLIIVPTLISPANTFELSSPKVDFSWSPMPYTTFDLYLWEAGQIVPDKPTFSSISTNSFSNTGSCKYGKSYRWRILARGECNEVWSDSMQFSIRTLPDLQVLEINYPDTMFAGDKIKVTAKIKNTLGNLPSTWWRDELALSRTAQLEGIVNLQSVQSWRTLDKDSIYIVEFNATLPLDTVKYTYFIVKTDVHNNVLEENETNNIRLSDAINIQKPVVQNEDFELLKRIFNQQNGNNWKRKWKINSNVLIAENWPGLSFNRGNVTHINLQDNNARGQLMREFFHFKHLTSLNLSYNQFEANVDTLNSLVEDGQTSGLNELYLQNNLFEGELSGFINQFDQLEKLNVSSNAFSLDSTLSTKIHTLNLNDQSYQIESKEMREGILFDTLPSISTYNHYRQDFNDKPNFHLYSQNNWVGSLSFWGGVHHLSWDNYRAWQIDSGSEIEIIQNNGYAYGSHSPFKIFFKKGDNNIDGLIDILDLQHGINFLLLKYPNLFNFNAGNTYPDESFTVQDIVTTTNKIMEQVEPLEAQTAQMQKVPSVNSELYIEQNHLYIKVCDEIAALDFTLHNCNSSEFTPSEETNNFSLVKKEIEEKTRTILYSLGGNTLPYGIIDLGKISKTNVFIGSTKACNLDATRIPVGISPVVSSVKAIQLTGISAKITDRSLHIESSKDYPTSTVSIFDLQGIQILSRTIHLTKGIQSFDWTNKLPNGIYLLKIKTTEGNVQLKLIKQ